LGPVKRVRYALGMGKSSVQVKSFHVASAPETREKEVMDDPALGEEEGSVKPLISRSTTGMVGRRGRGSVRERKRERCQLWVARKGAVSCCTVL
jgi:hypothetical protein